MDEHQARLFIANENLGSVSWFDEPLRPDSVGISHQLPEWTTFFTSERASIETETVRTKAVKDWAFGSTDQSITVYTTEVDTVLARSDPKAKFGLVADVTGAKTGFSGALGSGMGSPTFAETVGIVSQQANQHGVPVTRGQAHAATAALV